MNKRKLSGIFIFFLGAFFGHLETVMFGNNWYPKTMSELICDSIAISVSLYGWYLIATKK